MDLGTLIGVAGLLVGVFAAVLAWAPQRIASREESAALFEQIRRHLKAHRLELSAACTARQSAHRVDGELPLLTRPGWIPDQPLDLDAVRMTLREARADEHLDAAREQLVPYWPRSSGTRLESYCAAIEALDRPTIWFNGPSYRLLEARTPREAGPDGPGTGLDLTFTLGHYFDGLDTTEALGYEEALHQLRRGPEPLKGRYRRWLADPFVLNRRAALPGVNVLTVRAGDDGTYFFLHRRGTASVAVAMNTTHVAPAGEFQPHADVLPVWGTDLDLWRTIMREYAEEFLGVPDAAGSGGRIIDYSRDAPYASFERARCDGAVRVRFLGLGLDPLTWKPEICVLCVWDAAIFDRTFADMQQRNDEGVLVVGTRAEEGYRGIPFTADNVLGYARHDQTLPAGRACLTLAWRWRGELGLADA
ncbi:hypothetical protein [Streptomyces gibsoniae]|uniref:DUF3179 domain-containing protein n=1 Tax=Streptomyces gibsoniae TaxID=3075529 RepID=A0ABU2U857_9ACTN|nr:hypothetical protein [Streptomyces sp. DSM 41699]MDT0469409.1 hypothetical protein [Streptomyces sp. DSM 41699]